MAGAEWVHVEVAYALPQRQWLLRCAVPAGTDVRGAIAASGILDHCAGIDLARQAVGVFGEEVSLDTPVQDGDRVEIYRPLLLDPKQARRQRASGR